MQSNNPSLRDVLARALVIATTYAAAGTHEVGGNNSGDQVEFFLRVAAAPKGAPWCCAFVLTCMLKAFAQLGGFDQDRDSLVRLVPRFCNTYGLPRTAYCPTLWAALKRLGLTHDKHASVPAGALVFFDFKGQAEPHHVAFVSTASGQDRIIGTVEGNTPDGEGGNPADGDGVFPKRHSRSKVYGFAVA